MDITDVFGNYVQRDQRNDNAYHSKGYTGQEYDDVASLSYYHARYLNAPMHTFMSVDPMLYKLPQSYLTDPQQMNSYAYARNNPVIYTDPDGKAIFLPVIAVIGIASLLAPTIAAIYELYRPNSGPVNVTRAQTYYSMGQNMPGMIGPVTVTGGRSTYSGFGSSNTSSLKSSQSTSALFGQSRNASFEEVTGAKTLVTTAKNVSLNSGGGAIVVPGGRNAANTAVESLVRSGYTVSSESRSPKDGSPISTYTSPFGDYKVNVRTYSSSQNEMRAKGMDPVTTLDIIKVGKKGRTEIKFIEQYDGE